VRLQLLPDRAGQLAVAAVGNAESLVSAGDSHLGELGGIADRQASHGDGVDQLKDGRVRADAERERQHGGRRQHRAPAEDARGISKILKNHEHVLLWGFLQYAGDSLQPHERAFERVGRVAIAIGEHHRHLAAVLVAELTRIQR
jgi:hypothetical protein